MEKLVGISLVLAFFFGDLYGQRNYATIVDKRIVQDEIMYISYDIRANDGATYFSVELIPTYRGSRIKVSEAYGDLGSNRLIGRNEIIWYFKRDFDGDIDSVDVQVFAYREDEGVVPVEVAPVADRELSTALQRHKTMRNIWLGGAVATGAVGGFAVVRSNSLYNDYKTAREDAADIRGRFKTFDVIAPVAFIVSGVCLSQAILQFSKQKKLEQRMGLHVIPLHEGLAIGFTWSF